MRRYYRRSSEGNESKKDESRKVYQKVAFEIGPRRCQIAEGSHYKLKKQISQSLSDKKKK